MLHKIVHNPYLTLLSGLILLISSGYETWVSFNDFSLGSHHGILVFSIIQILKVIPELMHGLREIHTPFEPE